MVHNEVERRRKVKINNWIYRLGDLLPGCSDDKKISKNGILEKAVEYLKELQGNNDKLLLGHCSEVQVAEFQRMKERIQELEFRNAELTHIVESSGTRMDLETMWQQRGKYSHKIEPKCLGSVVDCQINDDDKQKPLLAKTVDSKPDNAGSSFSGKAAENVALLSQEGIVMLQQAVSKKESDVEPMVSNPSKVVQVSQSAEVNVKVSSNITQELLPNNSVTAVTQALPSLPIMSTSQHSSGNQQLLQQLPVLNYGNTVNIFPGLAGQNQPMIIINEQGVPLLQNLIPGQMILQQPGAGQPVALPASANVHPNLLLSNKNSNNLVTVNNELGNAGNNTVLLSALMGNPSGIGNNQIIVNTGLSQSVMPTSMVNQNPGQVVMNAAPQQAFHSNASSINAPNIVISSNSVMPMRAEISNFASALQSSDSNLLRTSTFSGPTIKKNESNIPVSALTSTMTGANQMVFGCPSNSVVNPVSVPLQQSHALLMRNGSQPMAQSPNTLVTQEHSLTSHIINQLSCTSSQQNAVHLFPRQNNTTGGQAVPVNGSSTSSNLPSALLLPNGQIIPVVSQPSLLYPAAAPVNGSLLMTGNPPTTIFQTTTCTNNQQQPHFKTIISHDRENTTNTNSQVPPPNTAISSCLAMVTSPTTKMDVTVEPMVFAAQNDKPISMSSTLDFKKIPRKCQRVIKPKPSSSAPRLAQTAEISNVVEVQQVADSSGPSSSEFINTRTESASVTNSVSVSTCVSTPATKSFSATTDILAKATESIFASTVSESSPPTSSAYSGNNVICSNSNSIASDSAEQQVDEKHMKTLEHFAESSKTNVGINSDIFGDLVGNVYNSEEKDMPTLQPISPVVKSTAAVENLSTNEEATRDRRAPQLSLMIVENSNETELPAKRSQSSKSSIPSKRQKSNAKGQINSAKETSDGLTSSNTTQNANFLSVSQLTGNSYSLDNSLTNEHSQLERLVGQSKSISSDSFLAAAVSSASSIMALPPSCGTQNTGVPCVNGHEMTEAAACKKTCSMTTGSTERNRSVPEPKSCTLSDVCSMKLPAKPTPNANSQSSVISSIYNPSHTSFAKTCDNSLSRTAVSSNIVDQATDSSGIVHNTCSALIHFPPNTQVSGTANHNSPLTEISLVGSTHNGLSRSFVSNNQSISSGEATGVTYSVATSLVPTCTSEFPTNTPAAPAVDSISINNSNSLSAGICTSNSLNGTNPLQREPFTMPDLNLTNIRNTAPPANFNSLGTQLTSTLNQTQCVSEPAELSAEVISETVPSFNFGIFAQHDTNQSQANSNSSSSQLPSNGPPRSFAQHFFPQSTTSVRPGLTKNATPLRNGQTEAVLLSTVHATNHGNLITSIGSASPHSENSQQSTSNSESLSFPVHRTTVGTLNYSAEALIGQTSFNSSQKQLSHSTTRPCLSYSAESLIQSQTDRRSHCVLNGHSRHQPGMINQPLTSSYPSATNPQSTFPCFSLQSNAKRSVDTQSCTVTSNNMSCTHPHQQPRQVPFSFTLGQSNSQSNDAQLHAGPVYSNMLHYSPMPSSGALVCNNKPSPVMQGSVFPQENLECTGVGQQHCSNYSHNSINSFPNSFPNSSNRSGNSCTVTGMLSDTAKLPQDKHKGKQESQINKPSSTKTKQSAQSKKKTHSVEEVNLSNSIFETNRSVTPYFAIPNLSPPRNEAPTYLANPNLFGATQRPLGTNASQQNKPAEIGGPYNPLFSSRSQTGLNLNFQAPGFSVNHLNSNSTVSNSISNPSNVPNFNLSNIFPDINNSGDNLSPIKFHPANSIISAENQHHQPPSLYNRPVLHNGMSINSFLAHNQHNFDGRPPVPMPINNSVPPNFGHSHTPTFSNVIPTLNFSMHDH